MPEVLARTNPRAVAEAKVKDLFRPAFVCRHVGPAFGDKLESGIPRDLYAPVILVTIRVPDV